MTLSVAGAVDFNPSYFAAEVIGEDPTHEWSRIYALELFLRIKRDAAGDHLTGEGGIFEQLALFGSSTGGKGQWQWDHEEVQGHYEAVATDPDT